MAERIEYPEQPATTGVHRYDWATWAARPFAQWILTQTIDFHVTPESVTQQISGYALTHGLSVAISRKDPYSAGRVAFRFYDREGVKPELVWTPPTTKTNTDDAPTITCQVCGAKRPVFPAIEHILECIERGSDRYDFAYYALHRPDGTNAVGLRRLDVAWVDETTWTLEEGPIRAEATS